MGDVTEQDSRPVDDRLTLEGGRLALAEHARCKGEQLRAGYGSEMDYATLLRLLEDRDCVHFPASLEFDSSRVGEGLFGSVVSRSGRPGDGYTIYLHEKLRGCDSDVVAAVLYLLVVVNYGDFATARDAEVFGAAALGVEQEQYYELVCELADSI
ncbi:MAG: hypothetical protein H8E45_13430 [Proteobacteria bacterium]|nr:hypothetical protein [Pseudomonadota bacterium]